MDLRKVYAMIASGFLLAVILGYLWFVTLLSTSYVAPARAVTASDVSSCADMPRGDQVLENTRLACFNELFGDGRWSL